MAVAFPFVWLHYGDLMQREREREGERAIEGEREQ